MGVMKSRRIDDKEKGKRALYSEGAVPGSSKLPGVNKTFLLGRCLAIQSGELLQREASPESVGHVRHEANIFS